MQVPSVGPHSRTIPLRPTYRRTCESTAHAKTMLPLVAGPAPCPIDPAGGSQMPEQRAEQAGYDSIGASADRPA